METLLDKGLGELGISFSDAQCRQLETYWSELAFWNGKYGLVNASGDELVIKHFLDSLAAVPVLRDIPFRTACDVGSGGGFPGLVHVGLAVDDIGGQTACIEHDALGIAGRS